MKFNCSWFIDKFDRSLYVINENKIPSVIEILGNVSKNYEHGNYTRYRTDDL